MQQTTIHLAQELLKTDASLTPQDRHRLVALLRNHGQERQGQKTSPPPEPRLIRRAEAARRMGVSLRAIDSWARAGLLTKVRLPGRTRAAGFRESELLALIEGKGPKP
jgi:hypothetical protein